MKVVKYSHNNGVISVPLMLEKQIVEIILDLDFPLKRRCASEFRAIIIEKLISKGWANQVQIKAGHRITITAIKRRTGLCLQTGNMARFYADLLKLQLQFMDKKIENAIYILPTKKAAKAMGDNMANYDRLTKELNIYKEIITIPLIIMGFSGN